MSLAKVKNKEEILDIVYKWANNESRSAAHKLDVYEQIKLALCHIPDEWISDSLQNINDKQFPLFMSNGEYKVDLVLTYGKYIILFTFGTTGTSLRVNDRNVISTDHIFVGPYSIISDDSFTDGIYKIICGIYKISGMKND